MIDGETAEDRDAGFDEVGGWVAGCRQLVDRRTEQLERTRPEGDKQTVLGAEQAVDGACGGADVVRQPPDRKALETVCENDPLGCIEQRGRGVLIVFLRPTHPLTG